VIRDYIETAQPVGSVRLVEHYGLDVSSATLRNEMVALTDMGYLRQPHTSAGRVPTEEWVDLESCVELAEILAESAIRFCTKPKP
jgi:hypothetical protein